MSANKRSRKGLAYTKIRISEKTTGEQHLIRPLTKQEVKLRIDWYSAQIPLSQDNPRWLKWAFKRLDELNALLSGTHSHRHGVTI